MTLPPEESLILVNEQNRKVGTGFKLDVHQRGLLHRAFSIFVFNQSGQLLLQQRAEGKYHSGGLWTNTCCGHPRPGELTVNAARRRLQEEMGFECPLLNVGTLTYHARVSNELIEHEFDYVYVGRYEAEPRPDPNEACAWKWIDLETLNAQLASQPELFTVWFKQIIQQPGAQLHALKERAARAPTAAG